VTADVEGTATAEASRLDVEAFDAALRRRFSPTESEAMIAFARGLFVREGERYGAELADEDRVALLASAFRFFATATDAVRCRLRTPTFSVDGWDSPYTIFESHMTDRPFIVDTIRECFHQRGIPIRYLLHPIYSVERDEAGTLLRMRSLEGRKESFVHCAIDRLADGDLAALERDLEARLGDVYVATEDYRRMRARLEELRDSLDLGAAIPADEDEIQQFVGWLGEGNFVFLGYGGYLRSADGERPGLRLDLESALGILRIPERAAEIATRDIECEPRAPADSRLRFAVMRSAIESRVHRAARMDVVVLRPRTADAPAIDEHRFYGLFTSKAYAESSAEIPVLREKLRRILAAEQVLPESHDYRDIESIFEGMPKAELFQLSADELSAEIRTIRSLGPGEGVRVRLRAHGRGVWVTVIVPRDRFSGEVRRWIESLLAERAGGPIVDYQLSLGEGERARLHFYVARPQAAATIHVEDLERRISERVRSWDDRLRERLVAEYGGTEGRRLAERYAALFTPEYKAGTDAASALNDVRHIEKLGAPGTVEIALANALGGDRDRFTLLNLYLRGEGIVLSDFLPLLENLGLRVFAESSLTLGKDENQLVIVRFVVQDRRGRRLDVASAAATLIPAIVEIRAGRAENDSLNRLIVDAGFGWREVDCLRTYRNLAFQVAAGASRPALNEVLLSHPAAARALFDLFAARFDPAAPDRDRDARASEARKRFWKAVEAVETATEDQMLRNYLALVDGTLRTNYFRSPRESHPFLAVKIHSQAIEFLPKPRPLYEVYVHSARMEGIHLRGGKVARGGIRWSDRADDFRSEILGLMKTQMVKNAVIVPVGSKGGFVVKRSRAGEEGAAEVRECYATLMRGLLDLTDDIVHGAVVAPAGIVRYDDDDPYLVVAADKGTATFSDLANSIAAEYEFWLGDAFASGGSHGYDHKKEGITARGAWKCVERHFRELGKDVRRSVFDVVGIGDMSGDVFGNGMLFSRKIRLRAAFNHLHVFLDPDPDPEGSYRERERLFALPRSSWPDYDRQLMSPGAMIVARGAKPTAVSAEVRKMLGIGAEKLDGAGLVRAILAMKTDLLFNGGIGTYVRAATETDAEVGDHANDGVRQAAAAIGAAVVAEGGNLGFTQRARIEFALRGGRIDTDAIDNSAGVDLSDHEVNLKILFQPLVESGELSFVQRDRILEEVKPAVIAHVLAHNARQALLLSLDHLRSESRLVEFRDQMTALEQDAGLDRALESLPDREALRVRRGSFRGLTRPELAVIAAYSKLDLQRKLLASPWIDDPTFERYLFAYFPPAIGERFREAVRGHRLRREIIAAELGNQVVDRMGSTFVARMFRDTAADATTVVASFVTIVVLTDADRVFDAIASARPSSPDATPLAVNDAYALCLRWEAAIESACKGVIPLLRAGTPPSREITAWARALAELSDRQKTEDGAAAIAALERLGLESRAARSLLTLESLRAELEIVSVSQARRMSLADAAELYRRSGEILDFAALEEWLTRIPGDDRWEKRAAEALREDLFAARRRMVAAISARHEPDGAARFRGFLAEHESELASLRRLTEDLASRPQVSIAAMVVVVREVWKLAGRSVLDQIAPAGRDRTRPSAKGDSG
jgi:glutamate dehydrogenase